MKNVFLSILDLTVNAFEVRCKKAVTLLLKLEQVLRAKLEQVL